MVQYTTISIPKPLAEKLKKFLKGTSFSSLSDYTTYILRMILLSAEMRKGKMAFTREDEEELKKRLKVMGYI